MFDFFIFIALTSAPLWLCVIYVHYVLEDNVWYYFKGWQPKAALAMFLCIILIIYIMPIFFGVQFNTQVAAAIFRRSSRLFSLIPSVSTAMIIFPELFGVFTGLEKAGTEKSIIHILYRSLGWLFLIGVFVLIWVL